EVEIARHGLRCGVGRGRIDGQTDLDALHVADAARADQLGRAPELFPGTLLAADLQDASRALHRVAQDHALGVRHGERLLQIDVLAGVDRGKGELGMPVIRRADDHRVDVLAPEQLAVVAEGADLGRLHVPVGVRLLDDLHAVGDAFAVQVADCDVFREFGFDDSRHVVTLRDAPESYLPDLHAAVGTEG